MRRADLVVSGRQDHELGRQAVRNIGLVLEDAAGDDQGSHVGR